ncbi:hypothetical protein U1Q18_002214 [Sarracenia purpurea var. burkii]
MEEWAQKPSLASPLIPNLGIRSLDPHQDGGGGSSGERSSSDGSGKSGGASQIVFEEAKRQVRLAGPLVVVSLLQYCLQVISIMFVGRLGELPLSGASLATSFASVTGFSVLEVDVNPYQISTNGYGGHDEDDRISKHKPHKGEVELRERSEQGW